MTEPCKNRTLSATDIIVLSLIFFGYATFNSIAGYLQLQQAGMAAPTDLGLDAASSYGSIVLELVELLAAWIYLRWRRFDFKALDFSVHRYTLPLTVLLIVCAGAVADAYQYLHWWIWPHHYPEASELASNSFSAASNNPFAHITPLFVFFALLNGFYEELFFMGLIFAVRPKLVPHAAALSIGVRFIFHLYQGLAGAATVTTLGIVFILFRRKTSALVPFMLAHAFFDVFGLGSAYLYWW